MSQGNNPPFAPPPSGGPPQPGGVPRHPGPAVPYPAENTTKRRRDEVISDDEGPNKRVAGQPPRDFRSGPASAFPPAATPPGYRHLAAPAPQPEAALPLDKSHDVIRLRREIMQDHPDLELPLNLTSYGYARKTTDKDLQNITMIWTKRPDLTKDIMMKVAGLSDARMKRLASDQELVKKLVKLRREAQGGPQEERPYRESTWPEPLVEWFYHPRNPSVQTPDYKVHQMVLELVKPKFPDLDLPFPGGGYREDKETRVKECLTSIDDTWWPRISTNAAVGILGISREDLKVRLIPYVDNRRSRKKEKSRPTQTQPPSDMSQSHQALVQVQRPGQTGGHSVPQSGYQPTEQYYPGPSSQQMHSVSGFAGPSTSLARPSRFSNDYNDQWPPVPSGFASNRPTPRAPPDVSTANLGQAQYGFAEKPESFSSQYGDNSQAYGTYYSSQDHPGKQQQSKPYQQIQSQQHRPYPEHEQPPQNQPSQHSGQYQHQSQYSQPPRYMVSEESEVQHSFRPSGLPPPLPQSQQYRPPHQHHQPPQPQPSVLPPPFSQAQQYRPPHQHHQPPQPQPSRQQQQASQLPPIREYLPEHFQQSPPRRKLPDKAPVSSEAHAQPSTITKAEDSSGRLNEFRQQQRASQLTPIREQLREQFQQSPPADDVPHPAPPNTGSSQH